MHLLYCRLDHDCMCLDRHHLHIHTYSDTHTTNAEPLLSFLHHIIQCVSVSTMKRLSNYPLLSNFIKPTNSLYQLSRYIYLRLHGKFLSYVCVILVPRNTCSSYGGVFICLSLKQSYHYNAVNAFITMRYML